MTHKLITYNPAAKAPTIIEIRGGEHWMSITRGIRGWFAVEYWLNNVNHAPDEFPEPWSSDPKSFEEPKKAYQHMKELAKLSQLPWEYNKHLEEE